MSSSRLADRVALVTGSSRGICREIVLELAREGATVVVNYHRSEEAARLLARSLEDLGASYLMLRGDVTVEKDACGLVSETVSRFGKLDILVNNVDILRASLDLPAPEDDATARFDPRFLGTLHVTRCAADEMRPREYGRIVHVATIASLGPSAGQARCVSKAELGSYTRTCALDMGCRGVTVNAVAPGIIRTRVAGTSLPTAEKLALEKAPLGRLGEPADVAFAVAFLVSDEASFITGQVIAVDGGHGLR